MAMKLMKSQSRRAKSPKNTSSANSAKNVNSTKRPSLESKLNKIRERHQQHLQNQQNQYYYPYQRYKKKWKKQDCKYEYGHEITEIADSTVTAVIAADEAATSESIIASTEPQIRPGRETETEAEATEADEIAEGNTVLRDSKYYQKWRSPFEDHYQCFRRKFRRMEIWYADLGYHNGLCFEDGRRPVLIVSNDANNEVAPIVTVVPMSSNISKLHLSSHVLIEPSDVSDVLITPTGRSNSHYYSHKADDSNNRSNCSKNHGRNINRNNNKNNRNGDDRNNTFAPYYEHLYNRPGSTLIEQMTVIDKRLLDSYLGQIIEPKKIEILNNAIKAFLGVDDGKLSVSSVRTVESVN